jgi:ACS family sodium-dependent inorganic phosphate cotransporter
MKSPLFVIFLLPSVSEGFVTPTTFEIRKPIAFNVNCCSLQLNARKGNEQILLDRPIEVEEVVKNIEVVSDPESEPFDNDNNNNDNDIPTLLQEFAPTLILCWFVALLSSLDRVAMSVAILPLSAEYHLTDTIKGAISSVFSIGYGLAIIPCGLLAATSSPRVIMSIGVALWSLATFGTPIAASLIQVTQSTTESLDLDAVAAGTVFVAANVAPLLFIRSIMGASESVVLPTMQRILANWVPSSKKSIAVATIFSGFQLGTVTAYLLSPWIIDNFDGWRSLFYTYGVVGVLWLVPWLMFSKDSPQINQGSVANTSVSLNPGKEMCFNSIQQEQTLDDSNSSSTWDDSIQVFKDAPWSSFAKSKAVWAMIVAHAANNWGLYNMLSWTPIFYSEQYGMDVKDSALFSIGPSIAGAICGLSAGLIADKVISSIEGKSVDDARTIVRRSFQAIALLGPAACLFTLSSSIPEDPSTAEFLLMGTLGLQAFNTGGYGSSPQEKAGGKWSGLLYSITTLPGVVFGSLGVYETGQILDHTGQDWSQVFSLIGGIYVVGALAFVALYDSRKEFD